MPRFVIELSAAIALTLAAVIASATGVSAGDLMLVDAFARASAVPTAKAGAAYVTVENHGASPDRLVAVRTGAAASAAVHSTASENGVMKMDMAGPLDVPANGRLEMRPGGYHVMLMGLAAPLKEGQSIDLTLTFEKAGDITVKVPVKGVAAGE